MSDFNRKMRRALADVFAASARKGLSKTRAGWCDEGSDNLDYYHSRTIFALEDRGLVELFNKRTCAHITQQGTDLHLQLREAGR